MNIVKFNGSTMTYTMDDGSEIPVSVHKEYLLQKKQGHKVESTIKKERKKRKYTKRNK